METSKEATEELAKEFHAWFTEDSKARGDRTRSDVGPWDQLDVEDKASRIAVVRWASAKFGNGGSAELEVRLKAAEAQTRKFLVDKLRAEAMAQRWEQSFRAPVDPVDARVLTPLFRTNDQEMEMELYMARVGLLKSIKQFQQALKRALIIPSAGVILAMGMAAFMLLSGLKGGG